MKGRTINAQIGTFVINHPEAWVMTWTYIGMAIGVTLCSAIGWWVLHFAGQGLLGSWCGFGFYAYQLAQNIEAYNANVDAKIEALKSLK